MSATLDLACELIRRRSITPEDAGCQAIMIERLHALGFGVQRLRFGEVENFWAVRGQSKSKPLFVFAGHTDVVPPGPLDQWHSDPFAPEVRDGYLYGRGAADMKGSLAAMITACEGFIAERPNYDGAIGFLITSDEEGVALDGTRRVVDWLGQRGETITACLVGEPSSHETLGDVIKNGRRGSLHGRLVVQGVQGHVAYPQQVRNPIHITGAIISALAGETWDRGNDFFPPTSFQISNIHAGTGATNVVPGELELRFNFRFSTAVTVAELQTRVQRIVDELASSGHVLEWDLSGQPFLTAPGALVAAVSAALREEIGITPELSTSGGTSDGRFIAPTGAQVVELGPVNATIHKLNERVRVDDLDTLSRVYQRVLYYFLE